MNAKRKTNIKTKHSDEEIHPNENAEEVLRTLALSSAVDLLGIDFDRGVWVIQIPEISPQQFTDLSKKIGDCNIKHVAIEFVR